MTLHICEVTEKNWRSVAALNVAKDQQQFIESNAFSLAESLYEKNGTSVGLYDGETLVGYAMYGWYWEKRKSVWLDRFMIDQRYQGKGYAKRFLRLLIQFLQNKFECKTIYLSLHPDNKPAMGLYESFGFRLNGDIDDEGPVVGVVMELLLDEHTSL
ncbi:TPA: GNAT family N-acetyltransferase [Bacillus cereus]|uniref:GNAT family N-acetyltransferase n=1 Tax=Bacillus tropicus TaxID=2026188 RepID=A0A5C5A6F1_9BACI|nr:MULTISPECIES: GNAT family N-acetyltransferase [Bacillus]ALL23504.1 spermidine acetyltransferase [Bacillus thuringiensis]EEM23038.1 Spermine/spermidine acetyltransferase [Bacillus thuringiensis serovar tochigiensis BGSC 4Y1]HDR4734433.1 GNAT family N-acetyltransferase [Bacillus cereus]MCB4844483.1 GNAT family N-acetyltransferase [Bacillus tropicus]MCC1487571.1 GNAT family N-acetyltransferase [Bacillus tropicus]